jgi:hypothetical protein
MILHILTLNAGSSSIKFGLYRLPDGAGNEPPIVARGLVDGIGAGPWIKVKNVSGAVAADRRLRPDQRWARPRPRKSPAWRLCSAALTLWCSAAALARIL